MKAKFLLVALAVALVPVTSRPARGHDGPGGHDPAVAKAAREMAEAADHLWASLSAEQKAKAGYDFKDDQRLDWHFIPRPRKGLSYKEMTPSQRALAQGLLASGLSSRGYIKAQTIMSLEEILRDLEGGKGPVRDPELYFFTVFGRTGTGAGVAPAAGVNGSANGSAGVGEPWGWRVEGHHISLNVTVVVGHGVVGGPTFLGANPAEVRQGPRKGLRALGEEEDLGRQLVKALDESRRSKATLSADAPKDILSFNLRKAKPVEPAGLLASEMDADQKAILTKLIAAYAERLRPEVSSQDLAKVFKAGFDKVGFAWAGGTEPGQPHYYRVQGPTFLLEYDNTQNNANHVHTVWRDFADDFGEDLLRRHYEQHSHVNGEHKD